MFGSLFFFFLKNIEYTKNTKLKKHKQFSVQKWFSITIFNNMNQTVLIFPACEGIEFGPNWWSLKKETLEFVGPTHLGVEALEFIGPTTVIYYIWVIDSFICCIFIFS